MSRRRGYGTLATLNAIARGYRHGFDIIDATGLPSGTIYPALGKLEADGFIQSRWEDPLEARRDKRPPRRYYELRPAGTRLLEELLAQYRDIEALPRSRALRRRLRQA
jgi:PadR family transcriptional regulator PadR